MRAAKSESPGCCNKWRSFRNRKKSRVSRSALSLIADGFGQHINKGYVYFAMGFSVFVEMINIRVRRKSEPVHLHNRYDN